MMEDIDRAAMDLASVVVARHQKFVQRRLRMRSANNGVGFFDVLYYLDIFGSAAEALDSRLKPI
jgi:hypothetical protein